eukprot:1160354-Pelagomonas_calceolata.AAC.7
MVFQTIHEWKAQQLTLLLPDHIKTGYAAGMVSLPDEKRGCQDYCKRLAFALKCNQNKTRGTGICNA